MALFIYSITLLTKIVVRKKQHIVIILFTLIYISYCYENKIQYNYNKTIL